jgi:hypothetical protein
VNTRNAVIHISVEHHERTSLVKFSGTIKDGVAQGDATLELLIPHKGGFALARAMKCIMHKGVPTGTFRESVYDVTETEGDTFPLLCTDTGTLGPEGTDYGILTRQIPGTTTVQRIMHLACGDYTMNTACGEVQDSILNCPICLHERTESTALQCGHIFCAMCIDKATSGASARCPTCRAEIVSFFRVYGIDGRS